MFKYWTVIFLLTCNTLYGQQISGKVVQAGTNLPLAYVNIGIKGKNIGTVSDAEGRYSLAIDKSFHQDSLLFSSVGYLPLSIKVADLREKWNKIIRLQERTYVSREVIVKPRNYKLRTLGVTSQSKKMMAGFKDNLLGYECGILIPVKKSAFIRKVNISIGRCSYDSIFFRLNIYKVLGDKTFENILLHPIYIRLPDAQELERITLNLEAENLVVEGNFLVTVEHIKNLGPGHLFFSVGLSRKTYYRKTSQGEWLTAPVGVGISVEAEVEK